MFKQYSCITRNGFTVNFDTQKRTKYSETDISNIRDRVRWGLVIREIAGNLSIPVSSVYNIMKREGMIRFKDQSKPSLNYLDRKECKYQYGMSNSQFDYATRRYKHLSINRDGKVYLHYKYFSDYVYGRKGYENNYKNFKWFTQEDT